MASLRKRSIRSLSNLPSARCASACVGFNQRAPLDHDGNIDPLAVECGPETIESGIGLGNVQHAFAGAQAVGQILGGHGNLFVFRLVKRAEVLALPERVTHFCIFSDSSVLLSFIDCLKVRFTLSLRLSRFADGLLQETSTVPFYRV